jgi:hypothetical protein
MQSATMASGWQMEWGATGGGGRDLTSGGERGMAGVREKLASTSPLSRTPPLSMTSLVWRPDRPLLQSKA